MAFPGHMCWTAGKWIQWPKVPFICLRAWSQCLWGSCWQRQLVGLSEVDKCPVLFGRHQPALPRASFCHSIWVAGKLFWQLSPWSSENCHLPFDPSGRRHLASALPWVAPCDVRDVVQSSPMKLASCCLSMGGVILVMPWIFFGHVEEVDEVGVMVFLAGAIDHNIIMDAYHSWAFLHDEVHLHLEDILGHFGSKWHPLEPVPASVGVDNQ